MAHGPVEYVPDSHIGDVGPFRKYENFSVQREYRIALAPGTGTVLDLRLGPLRDVAVKCTFEQLNTLEICCEEPPN